MLHEYLLVPTRSIVNESVKMELAQMVGKISRNANMKSSSENTTVLSSNFPPMNILYSYLSGLATLLLLDALMIGGVILPMFKKYI
jgi:hypothetical protein